MHTQREKGEILGSLHTGDRLLVLPNVWNPIGARILAAKGYPAVATASAAVSASLGYDDGERIRRSTLLDVLGRIARSVDVPVTADIERGYGSSIGELEETIDGVLDAGIVGINLEDGLAEGGPQRSIDEHCKRVSAAKAVAENRGLILTVNARVDSFLASDAGGDDTALNDAVERANAYAAAGADCVYPIGPGDERTARTLRDRIDAPINLLASPAAAPLSTLEAIGINRVSLGPFVFRTCLKTFIDVADALMQKSDYASIAGKLSQAEARQFLSADSE